VPSGPPLLRVAHSPRATSDVRHNARGDVSGIGARPYRALWGDPRRADGRAEVAVAEFPSAPADTLRSRNTIERGLGRGGMAPVHPAKDLRHEPSGPS
jgi:hypothetical protein